MELVKLNNGSAGGNSPTVYQTDPYNLVVQGSQVFDPQIPPHGDEVANIIPTLLAIDAVCRLRGSMGMDDVMLMLQTFSASAFRVETLAHYLVEEEAQALVRFQATGEADTALMAEWIKLISGHVSAGHVMRRVHLVRLPLTGYLRWEFAVQAASVAAGEDIRIVDLDEHPELTELDDFWLLDDRVGVRMRYDPDGRLIAPERIADGAIDQVRRWRDRAWQVATPLTEFAAQVG